MKMRFPTKHSSKYFVMLFFASCDLDRQYKLPDGLQCWRFEHAPLIWFYEHDIKKAQDALFNNCIYDIFTGSEIKSLIHNYQINHDRVFMRKIMVDKDLFWKIIGDRKEEFLEKCKEYKKYGGG